MRERHPSDDLWRGSSYYTPVRTIGVIERPKGREEPVLTEEERRIWNRAGRVPFGFSVRKPHYRWDHASGTWVEQ